MVPVYWARLKQDSCRMFNVKAGALGTVTSLCRVWDHELYNADLPVNSKLLFIKRRRVEQVGDTFIVLCSLGVRYISRHMVLTCVHLETHARST